MSFLFIRELFIYFFYIIFVDFFLDIYIFYYYIVFIASKKLSRKPFWNLIIFLQNLKLLLLTTFIYIYDEAEYLTSEKHDHCAQKVTYTKEENKNTL